jgi:hypothetical protein
MPINVMLRIRLMMKMTSMVFIPASDILLTKMATVPNAAISMDIPVIPISLNEEIRTIAGTIMHP